MQRAALSERRAHEKVGHHPFICSCLGAYATPSGDLCMLLKYGSGGNLLQKIRTAGGMLPIHVVRIIFAQILSSISHCHQKHVAHRDIKPENIMLSNTGQRSMLSDFGLASRRCSWNSGAKDSCGTPQYTSPEIALGKEHGLAVDSWSLGILLYEMLVGYTPFQSASSIQIVQLLRSLGKDKNKKSPKTKRLYEDLFTLPKHIQVPLSLVELMRNLLTIDPKNRSTVERCMKSSFFNESVNISFEELREGRSPLI